MHPLVRQVSVSSVTVPGGRKVPFAALVSAAATIASTLLGGGGAVVPIETAVRQTGWLLSPLLFLLGGAWTIYTSWLLIRSSLLSNEPSYETLAARTLGATGARTVQVLIVVNAFFLGVSVQGLFVSLVAVQMPYSTVVILGALPLLYIVPFMRQIDQLAPISYVTAITAVTFVGFVVGRVIGGPDINPVLLAPLPVDLPPREKGLPASTVWLECFATAVIAFVVQFNVLPLLRTFPEAQAERSMMQALLMGIGLPTTIYLTLELLSYRTFGDTSYDLIIDHYELAPFGPYMLGLLGLGQLLSYALLAHAGVTEVGKLCLLIARCVGVQGAQLHGHEKTDLLSQKPAPVYGTMAGEDGALPKSGGLQADEAGSVALFVADAVAGVLWVVMTTAAAVVLTDVGSLLALVGAVCAMPLMTIFPPLMYARCPGAEDDPLKPLHIAMSLFGVVATAACIWISISAF